eukprot:TRINITY_DN1866_c0_g1_i5.p2 TRINITY_DN1866_c0_g1~~TRINITY_DN1866_c0_g1_i5.p2  ORF type:complete len:118 (+),score=46.61 TRINITY_DN1866_c0_g1_i5:66-419(+)
MCIRDRVSTQSTWGIINIYIHIKISKEMEGLSGADAAREGARKRAVGRGSPTGKKVPGPKRVGSDEPNFIYSEDAPGLKVTPKTVLITSLIYIGVVVLLHIWSKIRASGAETTEEQA